MGRCHLHKPGRYQEENHAGSIDEGGLRSGNKGPRVGRRGGIPLWTEAHRGARRLVRELQIRHMWPERRRSAEMIQEALHALAGVLEIFSLPYWTRMCTLQESLIPDGGPVLSFADPSRIRSGCYIALSSQPFASTVEILREDTSASIVTGSCITTIRRWRAITIWCRDWRIPRPIRVRSSYLVFTAKAAAA